MSTKHRTPNATRGRSAREERTHTSEKGVQDVGEAHSPSHVPCTGRAGAPGLSTAPPVPLPLGTIPPLFLGHSEGHEGLADTSALLRVVFG